MISSGLNQLLKKIKRHRRSSLLRPGLPLPIPRRLFSLSVSLSSVSSSSSSLLPLPPPACISFCLRTIMRASHVEKGLFAARDRKCRASLIIGCTTTTILERLSTSGSLGFPGAPARQVERPPRRADLSPSSLSCRYRGTRRIAETVNQTRQGRVKGRGIGATRSSSQTSRCSTTRRSTETRLLPRCIAGYNARYSARRSTKAMRKGDPDELVSHKSKHAKFSVYINVACALF